MASFEFFEDDQSDSNGQARFTVFGVGGAGGNAVQHMLESDIQGVKFVCANTDKQALDRMNAQFKIQLGEQGTRGLGAGANPQVGQAAAEESRELIRQHLEGTDMVFCHCGYGWRYRYRRCASSCRNCQRNGYFDCRCSNYAI